MAPSLCSQGPLLHCFLTTVLLVIILFHSGHCNPKVPRCIVMAPNMLTVGVPFTAHVIVYEAADVTVTLNITDTETGELLLQQSTVTNTDDVKEVTFTLLRPPKQHDVDQYYVTLKASTSSPDIVLPSEGRILVTFKQGHVFTQLSQVMYHPGDQVRGHLFSTDEYLQLLERPDMRVEILDPTGIAVVWADRKARNKINDEKVSEGKAYTFALNLPEDARPGRWQVRVRYGYEHRAYDDVDFQVSNSNLSPLVVAVSTEPKTILPGTRNITVSMSANFPVRQDTRINGTARLEILGVTKEGTVVPLGSSGTEDSTLHLDGTLSPVNIILDYGDFRFADFHHLVVRSHIMDHVSGNMQTKNQVTNLFAKSPYVIKLSHSSPRYKPGLSYTLKIIVEDPSGNPVPDVNLEVKTDAKVLTLKTNKNGRVLYLYDTSSYTNRTSALQFEVRTIEFTNKRIPVAEQASMQFVVPKEERTGTRDKTFIRVKKANSNNYDFTVTHLNRNNNADYGYLHCVTTSKSKVQTHMKMQLTDNNDQVVSLRTDDVKKKMAPEFHLLVFYIRRDGDIISDSIWVNVTAGPCQNNIKLEGLPNEKLTPGGKLMVKLHGDNGTFVSTGLLEKRQFEGINTARLTKRKLAELMSSSECKQDGGEMTTDTFYRAGLTLLTTTGITVPARPSAQYTPPVHTTRRHRYRRSADKNAEAILEDWQISIEMKSYQINSRFENVMECQLNDMVGVWTIQAMGMSKNTGFCVSNVHEMVTRRADSRHMEILVPFQTRVGEILDVTFLYWSNMFTQVKAQLQVRKGLCSKMRPKEWSTPKEFNATANKQMKLSWPVVPLTATEHIVRIWVEAILPDFLTETFIIQKSFSAEAAGVHRKVEQTFLMGTVLTPKPARGSEEPCFKVLQAGTTLYNKQSRKQSMVLHAKVPSDALYESGKIEINIIGEPLGHILLDLPAKGISKLVEHHPVGCGEQSMMKIGPLVYAMLYLRAISEALPETKAVDIIRKEITHMDKFRNISGAYSTWPGKAPSTWLTAYVAKVFAQAYLVTEVNDTLASIVCQSARYVANRQKPNGCFDDPLGIVMDESIAGGVDSTTTMTAYITVALLEVHKHILTSSCPQLSSIITKAVNYLASQIDQTSDTYTLSMMAYGLMMSRTQRSKGEQLIEYLLKTAEDNENRKWKHWIIPRRSLTRRQRIRLIRNPVLAMEIETAAYTLLALLEANKLSEANGVAMWLTSQHRSNGRFISTQDTVIALQALTLYRSRVYSGDLNQKVNVKQLTADSRSSNPVHLTDSVRNLRYTYSYNLHNSPQDVLIELEGKGEVRVEAVCTYNTLQDANTCPFTLTTRMSKHYEIIATSTCNKYMGDDNSLCLQTCYSYANSTGTNMAILYIGLHHLHKPNMENLYQIVKNDANIDHVETSDTAVIFYLTQIPHEDNCVEFVVTRSAPFPLNTMPVAVHLYDYHDPERLQCERFYQPNSKLYSNVDRPIEYTYIKRKNEFVCGEEPQPPIHDYMKSKTPINHTQFEELLCNGASPANVYALNVTFILDNHDKFLDEHDATTRQTTYFLDAMVNKVVKIGSLPAMLEGRVRFYVQRSWIDFEKWVGEYKNHPHLVIGTDYDQHVSIPMLHLDKGDVYLQRLAPHKPWVTPETRSAWKKLPQETRNLARKNLRYLREFRFCKV